VAAAADGVAHPCDQHRGYPDDQEDDSDDHDEMSVGEGRDQGSNEESENDKDGSEDDHDIYLVSMTVVQKYLDCLMLPLAW
jgi:hypothetical protein